LEIRLREISKESEAGAVKSEILEERVFMKADELIEYKDQGGVTRIREVGKPEVAEGKLLVEVHAASVNPLDWKIRDGMFKAPVPAVLGGDFAGVVVEAGPDVESFRPGDQVFGMANVFNGGTGSFAEYDLADAGSAAIRPAQISYEEAAALPLTGVMALQAMDNLEVSSGKKILIHGGAGGIGSMAVQMAKDLGAYVAVTCAGDDFDYVRSLGADEAIDFEESRFEELLSDYDGVLDLVGGEVYNRSYQVLKPGGIIVSSLMQPDGELMKQHQVKAVYQGFEVTTGRLTRLAGLVVDGVVKVHIARTFPLEKADEAMTYQKTVHPQGKVVIRVK